MLLFLESNKLRTMNRPEVYISFFEAKILSCLLLTCIISRFTEAAPTEEAGKTISTLRAVALPQKLSEQNLAKLLIPQSPVAQSCCRSILLF